MDKKIVFTENPEADMWKFLLQYTYKARIEKYFLDRNIQTTPSNDELYEIISCSILQAKEYFDLAKIASLQTAPLLLYYGSSNLLLGATTLIKGKKLEIKNHGMKICDTFTSKSIGATQVRFMSPNDGGIHVFLVENGYSEKLVNSGNWSVQELLSSIPELINEASYCYDGLENYCIPINTIITQNGVVEKLFFENNNNHYIQKILDEIPNFKNSYLPPTINKDQNRINIILRHKYRQKEIAIQALSGQSFLQRGHLKNSALYLLPQWAYTYTLLFSLCSLCRYYPGQWNTFLRLDESSEKLLVEKFLEYTNRVFPNYILSMIENINYLFENRKYVPENKIKVLGEHEVKELLEKTQYKE